MKSFQNSGNTTMTANNKNDVRISINVTDKSCLPYLCAEQTQVTVNGKTLNVIDACHGLQDAKIPDDMRIVMIYQLRFANSLGLLGINMDAQLWTLWVQDDEGIHRMFVTATHDNTRGTVYFKNKIYDAEKFNGARGTVFCLGEELYTIGNYVLPPRINKNMI